MADQDFGFVPAATATPPAVPDTSAQDIGFVPAAAAATAAGPRGGDSRDLVTQSLLDHGATPVAAAAILGDIQQESNFNPHEVGDGGSSLGLLQVGRPMYRQFQANQAAQGINPGDPAYTYNQAPFILDKFKQQHPDRWDAMQTADSAPEALQIFRGTKDWGYGIAGKRYQYAQNYQQALSGVPVQNVDTFTRVEKGVPVTETEHDVARALPVDGQRPPLPAADALNQPAAANDLSFTPTNEFGFVPASYPAAPPAALLDPDAPVPGPVARAVPAVPQGIIQPGPDTGTYAQPEQPPGPDWTTGVGHVGGPMELPEPPDSKQFEGPFTSGAVQGAAQKAVETGLSYGPPILAARTLLPESNPIRQAAEAVISGGGQMAKGLAEPDNLAIVAASEGLGLPEVAGRVVSGYFAAQMASQTPELWKAFQEAPDFKSKVAIATQGVGNLLFAGLAAKHAITEEPIPGAVGPAAPAEAASAAAPEAVPAAAPGTTAQAPAAAAPAPAGGFGFENITVPGAPETPPAAPEAAQPAPEPRGDFGFIPAEPAPEPMPIAPTAALEQAANDQPGATPANVVDTAVKTMPEPAGDTVPADAGATQSIPLDQMATRPELMQYKRMDDQATGTTEQDRLTGEYDPHKAGIMLLWEPNNPKEYGLTGNQKYIVANGHYRYDFFTRQGVENADVKILRESDGYSAGDARAKAAEVNIADGKGTIFDQANFIREQAAAHGQDAALGRARQIGARGQKAATIALQSGPDLYTSFINEKITPDAAAAIAETAPGNEPLQRLGLQYALQGEDPQAIANYLQSKQARAGTATPTAKQVDLFGTDDTAAQEDIANGKRAGAIQKELSDQINTVAGAARRPEKAAALGVNVKDPAAVTAKLQGLRALRERARRWAFDPQVRDVVYRDDLSPEEAVNAIQSPPVEAGVSPAAPTLRPGEGGTGDLFQGADQPFNLAGETGTDFVARQKAAEADAAAKAQAAAQADQAQTQLFGDGQKLKLKADRNQGGFVNPEIFQDAVDFGKRLYGKGMDAAQWAGEMVRHLGNAIREHLANIWRAVTGRDEPAFLQRTLPGARESGALGESGLSGKPRPEPPSQEDFEAASAEGDKEKMRGHIATIQRMTEVSPDVKAQVESWYEPTTLDAVNNAANETINKLGLGKATDAFMASTKADASTMALGHNLALRLDEQQHYEDAAMVRDKMAEKLTTPAQSLWYISTIGKTSPEGLIRTAQTLVTQLIKPEDKPLLDQINRLRAEISKLKDKAAKDAATKIVIKQLARVNKPGQRLTAGQLDNLLQKHATGNLNENQLASTLTRYFKIPRLTPENIAKIKAAQKAWADVPDSNPILKQVRAADMMDTVYGLIPRTFWDKVRASSVIAMIMHGKLPLRIGASSALRLAGQTVVDGIENFLPDMGNIFSGRATRTGGQVRGIIEGMADPLRAYQAGYADAKIRGLATVPSFKEGMHALLTRAQLINRGFTDATMVKGGMFTFSSRFGRLMENTTGLLHNVMPLAFYDAAYRSSLYRQMRAARVEVPNADMVFNAHLDANKVISNNPTMLYKFASEIRKGLDLPTAMVTKGKYGLGTALLPFALKPASLLSEGLTWTPLGLGKATAELLRPVFNKGEPLRPKEIGDALIKAALGTGVLVGAGYQLAKIGVLTGAPDDNKDLEAMRKASGWGAYKINVSELKRRAMSWDWHTRSQTPADGDYIVNYNWLEPAAFPVAAGADLAQSETKRMVDFKRGKILPAAALSAAGAGLQSLVDSPMLQGVQQFAQAVGEGQWGRAVVGLFANVPGNFVPALVRQTAQYMDNTVRETRGTFSGPISGGITVDREASNILAQIPGLEQRYPPKYDVFGNAIERYNYGNNSLLNVFFNPAMVSKFQTNPQLAEMQRLYETTGATKGEPRQVPATLMVNGKQVELTNEQVATYQRYVGKEASAVVTRLLASPQFAAEPMGTKQAVIANVLGAVNNAAKMDLFGQSPVTVGMGMKGPTVSKPSVMDVAALIAGRRQGLKQSVMTPSPVAPQLPPLWRLAPPPALPSVAP